MKVKLWGTRGSIPSPGPDTIRYGGNTSCVGVTLSDGSLLALDAGTGIRNLGLALAAEPARLHILLTHLHLDHIQGLVFFAPAFQPQTEIVIWGPASPEASLRERIARYISAPLSPIEVKELPCDVSFRHCPEPDWEIGPARIRAASVAHRGPTLGYRIDDGDQSLAYIPDHEPALGADLDSLEEDWISGFSLARDASMLIHDGQYADSEYPNHVGWGHSALSHSLSFADRTGAEPHDPLPPRSRPLRRTPRPARARKLGSGWVKRGGDPSAIELGGRGRRVRPRLAGAGPPRRPRRGRRAYSLSRRPCRVGSTYQSSDEHRRRGGAGDDGHQGAEQDVGDQGDRPGHRQRQEGEADDREAVGDADQLVLALEPEGDPVVGGRRDQERGRDRGEEQGREVDLFLERRDFGEVLLERDGEQEGEEDLDAGQRDPQLLQQLAEIAVEALGLALVPSRWARRSPIAR